MNQLLIINIQKSSNSEISDNDSWNELSFTRDIFKYIFCPTLPFFLLVLL